MRAVIRPKILIYKSRRHERCDPIIVIDTNRFSLPLREHDNGTGMYVYPVIGRDIINVASTMWFLTRCIENRTYGRQTASSIPSIDIPAFPRDVNCTLMEDASTHSLPESAIATRPDRQSPSMKRGRP